MTFQGTIIAFDPGGTTGWRALDYSRELPIETLHWSSGILGPGRHHLELWGLLQTIQPHIVVCEHFVPQERKTVGSAIELISRNYEGVIELWCLMHGVQLHMQNAAEGKSLFTEQKITRLALWKSTRHERDATAHLLHYITTDLLDYRWIRSLKGKDS